MTNHLETAREYIAIAESSDSKRAAYEHAADAVRAWIHEDPARSYRDVDRQLGTSEGYAGRLVRWRTSEDPGLPFARTPARYQAEDDSTARRVAVERPDVIVDALRDAPPEVREQVARSLPPTPEPVEPIAEGTAAEYMRNPAPDPSDRETDHLAMQAARICHEGASRVERFGVWTMNDPKLTIEDLDSVIRDAGNWRAALIEHVNERALS
jgi:hypothetical protein